MANFSLSQYMNLPVPTPTVDTGPDYAFNLNSCLTILDQHNHASGTGQQITPAGISINQDMAFNGFNATVLRSSRYQSNGAALGLGSDIGCLYVAGADLYYNDTNSNQIRITKSGSIVASPGNISNLIAPAAVNFLSGPQTFQFLASTGVAANIDAASLVIRSQVSGSSGLTMSVPNNVANYTLQWPASAPSTGNYLTVNANGQINYALYAPIPPFPPSLIAARYYGYSYPSSFSGASSGIKFANMSFDTNNAYSTTTGYYSAPSSGIYRIQAEIVGEDNTTGDTVLLAINVNDVQQSYSTVNADYPNAQLSLMTSDLLNLNVGDKVSIVPSCGHVFTLATSDSGTRFTIYKI